MPFAHIEISEHLPYLVYGRFLWSLKSRKNYNEYKKQYDTYTKDIKKLESEISSLQSKKKSKTEIITPDEIERLKKAKQELADLTAQRAKLRADAQAGGYSSKESAQKSDKEANARVAEQIKQEEQNRK